MPKEGKYSSEKVVLPGGGLPRGLLEKEMHILL